MGVLRAGIYMQLFEHLAAQLVLGKHSAHCFGESEFRLLFHERAIFGLALIHI